MKVAITGGIGSGKSYVCRLLNRLGVEIYDCDTAAKRLMRTSPELQHKLTLLIGPKAYDETGRLNKAEIARFLLASEQNARNLDNIVHPAVADDFLSSNYQWMECAILYESGFDRLVDKVIAVTAPEDIRIGRIMQRDGISKEKALEWMKRQLPQDELVSKADFEIVNDGMASLDAQINKMMKKLGFDYK